MKVELRTSCVLEAAQWDGTPSDHPSPFITTDPDTLAVYSSNGMYAFAKKGDWIVREEGNGFVLEVLSDEMFHLKYRECIE